MSKGISFDDLVCPVCKEGGLEYSDSSKPLNCSKCSSTYNADNGILDLRTSGLDTQLDIESYDEAHGISKDSSSAIANLYYNFITDMGSNTKGKILEIGSGSGNLSVGISEQFSSRHIYFSDISPTFLKITLERTKNFNTNATYLLFDANFIPFKKNTLDIICGHSVLHHFAEFEKTLISSYSALKKGGVAIFGEPILNTQAIISLVSRIILNTETNYNFANLSKKQKNALLFISELAAKKRENLSSNRNQLQMEDKFMFPVNYMGEIAKSIGYREFCCKNELQNFSLSAQIKKSITRIFKNANLETENLNHYNFIFDACDQSFLTAMNTETLPLFSYFIFKK